MRDTATSMGSASLAMWLLIWLILTLEMQTVVGQWSKALPTGFHTPQTWRLVCCHNC